MKGKKLAGAYEIHKFIRDTKDTLMRIKDKESSVQVDDLGKSIQGVLALQRKMETFEREVAALATKVTVTFNTCLQGIESLLNNIFSSSMIIMYLLCSGSRIKQ